MFPYNQYLEKLWPICRSITGNGVRQSLDILSELLPINKIEIPTGQQCFDWKIPNEWNIQDAWIKDSSGNKVIDFKQNNLHLVSYSIPTHQTLTLTELRSHLHSLPEQPDAIPYRTGYYKEQWGFCLTHNELLQLKDDEYEIFIDSSLEPGSLTLGEAYLPGNSDKEIFLSSYLCHPSMANNELSGPLVLADVYQRLKALREREYSYRFLLGPETIGAIAYLSKNHKVMKKNLYCGLHLAMLGNNSSFHFSKSRLNSSVNTVAENIFSISYPETSITEWTPGGGGDQRQYCSPGINLPVAYLTRAWQGKFPEYHTSLDTISNINNCLLEQSADAIFDLLRGIELNKTYKNNNPYCEPQLGKYGLYDFSGGEKITEFVLKLKYILAYSDGTNDLSSIANKLGVSILELKSATTALVDAGLIKVST